MTPEEIDRIKRLCEILARGDLCLPWMGTRSEAAPAYNVESDDGYRVIARVFDSALGDASSEGALADLIAWLPALPALLEALEASQASWRCFHCDEVFTDFEAAKAHFGESETSTPACRVAPDVAGLVTLIRQQEEDLRELRSEEAGSYREFYRLGAEHQAALKKAEQAGFDSAAKEATEFLAALEASQDRVMRLEEALRPFAKLTPNQAGVARLAGCAVWLTDYDFSRARAALQEDEA